MRRTLTVLVATAAMLVPAAAASASPPAEHGPTYNAACNGLGGGLASAKGLVGTSYNGEGRAAGFNCAALPTDSVSPGAGSAGGTDA